MKFHWLTNFCAWLEQTWPSLIVQKVSWIVPLVQTVHILAIAMVLASAVMIVGRLTGWAGTEQSARQFCARFLPFIWWPLLALLATGIIMIVGEPARELTNGAFQLKMLMLIGAITATRLLQLKLGPAEVAADGELPGAARLLGLGAMVLWVGIIFAGRWIAYYT